MQETGDIDRQFSPYATKKIDSRMYEQPISKPVKKPVIKKRKWK